MQLQRPTFSVCNFLHFYFTINSYIPVVKKDLLADFIVNYKSAGLTAGDINSIRTKIEACKVDK